MGSSSLCGRWMTAVVVVLGLAASARAQDPLGYVTVTEGGSATRGANGPTFAVEANMFSDRSNGLFSGDSVVTGVGGTATVSLPEFGAVVFIAPSSELRFDALPVVDKSVSIALTLLAGRASVTTRPSDDRWLLLAGAPVAGRGYTVSKGASMSVAAAPDGVVSSVAAGSATYFDGDAPAELPVSEAGEPVGENGRVVSAGQRIAAGGEPEAETGEAGEWSYAEDSEHLSETVYRFGLGNGVRWVELAESGDFTPVRLAEGATAPPFGTGELEAEFRFDQPRSTVVAPAPRAQTQAITTQAVSPVRTLLESRRPTSVVVGQRLARTRIIGSPGTQGGPIRINPNAEVLIRLPR